MDVDFLSPLVIFTRTKELGSPLSAEESEKIFTAFDSLHGKIILTIDGIKVAAKTLSQISNKKIKLNHSLEIMSREFFNLNWHTLLPKLEREESVSRLNDILFCLKLGSNLGRGSVIFTPGLREKEEKLIKEQYPQGQLLKDEDTFFQSYEWGCKEIEQRISLENRELEQKLIACPYYASPKFHQSCSLKVREISNVNLIARGRAYGVLIYVPNYCISYRNSDRIPERYKLPQAVTFSNKNIFKVSKG